MLYTISLFLLPLDENCMNVCFVSVDTVNKYYTILYYNNNNNNNNINTNNNNNNNDNNKT